MINAEHVVGNRFCKFGRATLLFFEIFPNKNTPVEMGYIFTSIYTKEEIGIFIMMWYAREEFELLT